MPTAVWQLILLGATAAGLERPGASSGPILESFVAMELRRQLEWAGQRASLFHLRTKEHLEVDAILETYDGRIAGVEVKASATVRAGDFAGLRHLAEKAGKSFVAGVVLYAGSEILSFGAGMTAAPISALWSR